jgi:outer membrane lipoprotein-sorting protein
MIGLSRSFLEKLPYIQTMYHKRTKNRLTILSGLIASACWVWSISHASAQLPQPSPGAVAPAVAPKAAEPPAEPPTEAERLIDQAIKKLAALKSVAADMLQHVQMLKQDFLISGRYLKAPGSRIYQKLTVTGLPDSSGTTLQICDGDTLWDYQQILETKVFRKLSIKPVLERLGSPEIDSKTRDQIITRMGFAGPETLLVGLRKVIRFDQKEEGTLDGKAVWILRGTWRTRNGLTGPDQRPVPATGPLPAFIPSLATVYLGKDDGWPYKLILVGKVPTILQDTRLKGVDGRPIGRRSSIEKIEPSRIELSYSNVRLNPTLSDGEFAFSAPSDAMVEDNTEVILKSLEQAIQVQAMQKRAQAAQQDGPVLDQAIEIPKPPTEPTPK